MSASVRPRWTASRCLRGSAASVNISAAQFGADETAELVIAVDKTFVPASIPQLQSKDVRELGIRVFRAYVQPK